jgi:hypothetical protein
MAHPITISSLKASLAASNEGSCVTFQYCPVLQIDIRMMISTCLTTVPPLPVKTLSIVE